MASFGECSDTYATFFWVRSTLLPQSHTCFSASRLVIPYVSWIFAESCSRLPDICWRSSELSLAQFSFAEPINCCHLLSTCSQFIPVSLVNYCWPSSCYLPPTSSISSVSAWLQSSSGLLLVLSRDS